MPAEKRVLDLSASNCGLFVFEFWANARLFALFPGIGVICKKVFGGFSFAICPAGLGDNGTHTATMLGRNLL